MWNSCLCWRSHVRSWNSSNPVKLPRRWNALSISFTLSGPTTAITAAMRRSVILSSWLLFYFILSTIATIPSVRLLKPGEKVTMGLCGPILQVTNEIIRLCTQSIALDQIFEGYVSSSKRILNDCIWCCQSWRETYCSASQIQQKYQKLQNF